MTMVQTATMLETPVAELLVRIADERPTPGGGSVAALAVAMAAALVEMVAGSAEAWEERRGAAAQASALQARVARLAPLDAAAYQAVLDAFARPPDGSPSPRDWELGRKLGHAAEVPLRVAEAAADVAELAALAAERGDPRRRPDAVAAALLAEAGARAAAHLVAVNLASAPGDGRVERAERAASAASAAAARTAVAEAADG
jgi:formiminotetrahydrofolate cyclodeaminase